MTTGNQASRLTPARFGLYVKIAVVVIIALYLLSFIITNIEFKTEVWILPWWTPKLAVLWIILLTAGLTLLLRYLVKWLLASFRQMRRNGA